MALPNPGYDADMLRRAAEACRNILKQATGCSEWFTWVPEHLDRLADRLEEVEPDYSKLSAGRDTPSHKM